MGSVCQGRGDFFVFLFNAENAETAENFNISYCGYG